MASITQTPPPIGPVLRADARRNREAVLAAAKKLFADQGLDAQMPDVARVAKVGVGTVYRHFPTKDDLIAALVAERFERLAEGLRLHPLLRPAAGRRPGAVRGHGVPPRGDGRRRPRGRTARALRPAG